MWIENKKSYRRRQVICAILGICVSLLLTSAVFTRQEVLAAKRLSEAQMKLSEEVFRFHVLANSDSEEDQNLKLKVRDVVLAYMEEAMSAFYGEDFLTADMTKEWVLENLTEIEQVAYKTVYENGYDYPVHAEVVNTYFPDRRYGEVLFPKGYYEALRVEIGEAAGHNWWCVLYPSLCFTDATCAVVTEEGEQKIQGILCEEDYETITVTSDNFKIKSFFYELFKGRNGD